MTVRQDRDCTFPKRARVRKRSEFQAIYKTTKPVFGPHLVCYLQRREDESASVARLGLTIPRKTGNAVVRNRLKRQLRDIFRQRRADLPGGLDIIINSKKNAAEACFEELAAQVDRALRRTLKEGR